MTNQNFNERVHFRLIKMDCCKTFLCCINSRFYTYCPECGKLCYPQIKQWVLVEDTEAWLKYKQMNL